MTPINRTTAHALLDEDPTFTHDLGDSDDLFMLRHAITLALASVDTDLATLTAADGVPVAILDNFRTTKTKLEAMQDRLGEATGFIAIIEPDPDTTVECPACHEHNWATIGERGACACGNEWTPKESDRV